MSIIKCPRCDINFIREEEQYCSICKREMKGEMPKEEMTDMCIECGEHPAVPGEVPHHVRRDSLLAGAACPV